jgi:DNA-binding transcriptional MerR regulator
VHARREGHRREPTQQVDLETRPAVAQQHHGRGVPRRYDVDLAAQKRTSTLGETGGQGVHPSIVGVTPFSEYGAVDRRADYGGNRMAESLTVTELADAVGMTVRNIRAYQSRGLLHPPVLRGRVAHYTSGHVARLHLVASLQQEGFTLGAIKRLVDTPNSYAAIVADRRRTYRDETPDVRTTVALPVGKIRELLPGLPEDLTETGLVWWEDGQLVTHMLLMGVGRTLAAQGIPVELLTRLQLEAAATARTLGLAFRKQLETGDDDHDRLSDLSKVAVQLSAAAFEIAFLSAARDPSSG